jgi:hypothetical protein
MAQKRSAISGQPSARTVLDLIRDQQKRIDNLDARVKALEAADRRHLKAILAMQERLRALEKPANVRNDAWLPPEVQP